MKNVFVAVIKKALGADRFEMAVGSCTYLCPHLAPHVLLSLRERIEVRAAALFIWPRRIDRDRFDPVNCVL
jgi:hypothetical protein